MYNPNLSPEDLKLNLSLWMIEEKRLTQKMLFSSVRPPDKDFEKLQECRECIARMRSDLRLLGEDSIS